MFLDQIQGVKEREVKDSVEVFGVSNWKDGVAMVRAAFWGLGLLDLF